MYRPFNGGCDRYTCHYRCVVVPLATTLRIMHYGTSYRPYHLGTYGLITRSYPAVLDQVILGIIAVVGTIVGFAYCINNLLPVHTMNNFLVVLQSMTSPSFWSALWSSNHEFVSAFVISLFSAAGFIPYIFHRISKD